MNLEQPDSPETTSIGPAPPDELLIRVGVDPSISPEVRLNQFNAIGEAAYRDVLSAIDGVGRELSVLDFGCGSGRIMRWFTQHSDVTLTGCDIHRPTIEWMRSAYPDGTRLYVNDPEPPLPEADESFDLIYCSSVFSHLPDWAPWLLELRRILKPNGILVVSIHGRGYWSLGHAGGRGVPWDEDRTGLLVENYGTDFETGWGPAVYVSEWWVREHWGRAFDIVRFEPTGFALPDQRTDGQAWIVAQRPEDDRGGSCDVEALQEPGKDPRELAAATRAQWLAYEEVKMLRGEQAAEAERLRSMTAQLDALHEEQAVLKQQLATQDRTLSTVLGSRSWKLTALLRQGRARLRR